MRLFYSATLYLLLPFLLLRMVWRSRLMPGYRHRLGERFGWFEAPVFDGPVIWVHAVSLGETQAAAPMVEALLKSHPDHRIVMTTSTPTGSERVRALFADRVFHCYAPWDLPGSVARFLHRVRPRVLVLMETELWPNTINRCRKSGCRVVLANGRLSQRSADGYARIAPLARDLLEGLDVVACQSREDGRRFVALGLPPAALEVTGSIKFDVTFSDRQCDEAGRLRRAYQVDARSVLLAASTHPGEEELVLSAFSELRSQYPECLLLLVPRHPERAEAVEALCRRGGWRLLRHSSGISPGLEHDILVVDTVGELVLLQAVADIVLVCGSLVSHGGHNPLEAAAWGVPLVCGPHMENFTAIARQLVEAGAMIQVAPEALTRTLLDLLGDGERKDAMGAAGRRVVAANRGALERLLELIEDQLAA